MRGQWGTAAGYGKARQGAAAPLIPPAAGYKGAVTAAVTAVPSARQPAWQQPAWQDQWQKEDRGPPRVLNLELTQESQLTTQGFPPEAPAIEHDKSMTVFSSAHSILSEVVGDISSEVEIHHDTEWDIFPEIGEAIQRSGGEESCFSVVTCPNHGKWAVGIAAGKKGREVAGKLALAFALLVDRDPADLENFCRNYAEFRAVLADAGLLPPRGGPQKRNMHFPPASGKGAAAPPFAAAAPAPTTVPHAAPHFAGGFPQFLWISLDSSANMVQEGLPSEGFCVYYDKQFAELFKNGQFVLQEAIGDVNNEVVITHDADWDKMPEIAEAVKQGGGEENCYAVATLPSHGLWAVGLAGGWKVREAACKLALSVALVASSGEIDRFSRSYPDFAAFCNAAGTPGASSLEPAPKKAKVEAPKAFLPPAQGKFADDNLSKGAGKGGDAPAQAKGNGKKGNPFAGKKFAKPLPRDSPIWVQLPQDQLAPEVLQEFGSDAVAVATDRPHMALYKGIDAVLKDLVASPEEDITFIDDPNWDQFPEVGQALKPHSSVEEPIQLSTCSNLGCWGVGVGRTPDARRATSKVAIAAMVALKAAEVGEVPDLSAHPEFSDFVGSVQPPI